MNSNNYRELLEKYYSGDTSVEEERLLKDNGQLPLAELSSEKPVMDWSFDEFLAAAAQKQSIAPKGILQQLHPLKYAAAIAVIALLAIALYTTRKETRPGSGTAVNPPAITRGGETVKDSGNVVKPVPVINNAIAKSNPVKKPKRTIPAAQPAAPQKNDDFFVMVDGKRITDENEALAILQQSLQKISGNVQQAMAGINNSPKLDVKFK